LGQNLVVRIVQVFEGFLADVFMPQSNLKVHLSFGRFGF